MATDDKQHWMGFNIYAFIRPTTRAEYSALLDEALSLAHQLSEQFDGIFAACQKARDEKERTNRKPLSRLPLSFWTHGRRPGGKPFAPAGAAATLEMEFET